MKNNGNSKKMFSVVMMCIIPVCLVMISTVISQTETEEKKTIQLPAPKLDGAVSLEKTLATRRSIRQFSDRKFTMDQIGQLAWAAQGITEPKRGLRTAPSARATYPIQLYLASPSGLYLYIPQSHSLQVLTETDLRGKLAERQVAVTNAGCNFIIAAKVRNTAGQYGRRADNSMYLEAGHIAQNILLEAVSLGLAGVPVGGFDPNNVGKVCNLPSDQEPIYMVATGYPAPPAPPKDSEKKD